MARIVALVLLSATTGWQGCALPEGHVSQASKVSKDATSKDATSEDAGKRLNVAGRVASDAGPDRDSSDAEAAQATADAGKARDAGDNAAAGGDAGSAGSHADAAVRESGAADANPTESITEAVDRYLGGVAQRFETYCPCIDEPALRATCDWSSPTPRYVECMASAYERLGPTVLESVQCAADNEARWAQCYATAQCSAVERCDESNFEARGACDLPDDVRVNRCVELNTALIKENGFVDSVGQWFAQWCRCRHGDSDDAGTPVGVCAEGGFYGSRSAAVMSCAARNVFELEADNADAPTSPAIELVNCMTRALQKYNQCTMDNPSACDRCSDEFTMVSVTECGPQGGAMFACIADVVSQ